LGDRSFPPEIELIAVEPTKFQFSSGLVLAHDVEKEGVHEHFRFRLKILGIDRIGNLEQVLAQVRLPGCPHQLEEVRTGPCVVEDFEGFAGETLRTWRGRRSLQCG